MATNNFNAQDLSGRVFRPIKSSWRSRPYYKGAKVAPEEWVAPQATYSQVSMYDRWANDFKHVKVHAQVPLNERWNNDSVG